ncbi:MAG TPA: MMPL family transporter [Kofleriaceae bacterium]|nr:MMPL family transporter [Kofleriaceae bacterium]
MDWLARVLTRIAVRWPKLVVACGVAVALTGIALASQLGLQTDLSELLPSGAPSVVALRALNQRVGGTGNVAIALESPGGAPALRAYIPTLAAALRRDLGSDLLSIRYSRKELEDFYRKFAAYYTPLPDLERWQHELATAIAKQNPAYIDLDDNPRDPLKQLADEVRASKDKLDPKADAADPETGLLMTEHGHLAVVFVRPASNSLNLGGAAGMLERIQRTVDATDPEGHGIHVAGYTGSIPVALTEVAAIRHDIVSTAIFVLLGVGAIVTLYFGGIRELVLMSGAVTIGAAVALGFAELWIGHVNAQTAFLGAIIVGTGINYGIIFLDRYRRARVSVPDVAAALEAASAQTMRATGIAALATACSFGVLAAGNVESFHQFGWIGGIGILACWVATFTVVPACIALADRDYPIPRPLAGLRVASAGFSWLATRIAYAPRAVVVATIAVAVAGGAIAVRARGDVIETNLRKLGTRSADTSGIESLDQRLRFMDDRSATPAVIATRTRDEAREVCEILNARRSSDLHEIMRRCYSIANLFPRDLERRARIIAALRADLDAVDEDDLGDQDRKDLAELRRALAQPPPADADLPRELAEFFVERDGSLGKLAYAEPISEEIESNLYTFTDAMREIRTESGHVVESSGELVVFADVLRAMRRDATVLTIAAAALVMLVLVLATRRLGAFVRVGGALVAGVATMVGAAVLLGVKLNFFNFVALPTTFGIGIDYAINIEESIRQSGRGQISAALAESGPPVLLASMTSMIGYASLIPADSRALASFGLLAIIGEMACVAVAVVLVPAAWALTRSSKD